MNYRSLLIVILCGLCALPALLVPRDVGFEHASVSDNLTLVTAPETASGTVVSPGDRLIGVDGQSVDSKDAVDRAVAKAPRLVPVRVLLSTPQAYAWNPGNDDEEVTRLIESGKRVVSIGGSHVFEQLALAEAVTLARERAVDAGSVTVELADSDSVVDGAFLRSYAGPTTAEIAVAIAFALLLALAWWLLRVSEIRYLLAIGLLLSSAPYFARYVVVPGPDWVLPGGVALLAAGSLTLAASLLKRRSAKQHGGAAQRWRPNRSAQERPENTADPANRVAFALERLAAHVGEDTTPEFVVGFNRRAVRIRRVSSRLRVEIAEESLHAGLSMLAIEGGVLPRTETITGMTSLEPEDDPFTGLQQRLNILAAVPLPEIGDGTREWAFAVAYSSRSSDSDSAEELPSGPPPLAELIEDLQGPMLSAELKSLAADELLRELERISDTLTSDVARHDRRPAPEDQRERTQPPPFPTPDSATKATATGAPLNNARRGQADRPERRSEADEAYLQQLSDELQQEYPLTDPAVLTPNQWVELDPLITDDARPYLIIGEPGVGKELRARLIHRHSPRALERMAVVECAGSPESVISAHLLGSDDTEGVIPAVAAGSLILKSALQLGQVARDDIIARCASNNVRLAFIERGIVEPRRLPSNVPRSMRQVVGSRWLTVPPLHETEGETLRVAERFLHEFSLRYGLRVLGFSERAAEVLEQMEFAANAHELRAICLAAVLRTESGDIAVEQLMATATGEVADVLAEVEAEEEKRQIVEALHRADGNKSEASRMLGMSRGTLLRRLKQYKLV